MAYYRVYYFSGDDHISAFDETHCDDDAAALIFAAARRGRRAAELWNQDRLVARLDARALMPADAGGAMDEAPAA